MTSNHQTVNQILIHTLERIRVELGISHSDWAAYLHLTQNEYEAVRQERMPLSAVTLHHVSAKFSFNPMTLLEGNIDYAALALTYSGSRIDSS